MLFLTDDPEHMRCVGLATGDWARVEGGVGWLDACGQVWEGLGGGRAGWMCGDAEGVWPGAGDRVWVLIHEARGSQFDALVRALDEGVDLPDGLVCLACSGTGFHGQGGRPWAALAGNLHLTLHYRIDAPATPVQAALVMLPAVAVVQAVGALSSGLLRPEIKWVNDLLIDGQKIAGVLTHTQVEGDRVTRVVFGIGLNLATRPAPGTIPGNLPGTLPGTAPAPGSFPAPAPTPGSSPTPALGTGSRAAPGTPCAIQPGVPSAAALADFVPALSGRLGDALRLMVGCVDGGVSMMLDGGAVNLYALYRASAGFIGQPVRIWPTRVSAGGAAGPIAAGRVFELLPDLSLRIEGHPEPIRHGRMELMTPPPGTTPGTTPG